MLAAAVPAPCRPDGAGTGRRRGHRQPVPGGAGAGCGDHGGGDRSRAGGAGQRAMPRPTAWRERASSPPISSPCRPNCKRDFDHVFCQSAVSWRRPGLARCRRAPRALMTAASCTDWLKLGLQRTVSGGYFHRHPARRPADRGAGGAARTRRHVCPALAASRRGGQAGDPAGRKGSRRAVPPAAGAGAARRRTARYTAAGRRHFARRRARLPWRGAACRFRPISKGANSWPKPGPFRT